MLAHLASDLLMSELVHVLKLFPSGTAKNHSVTNDSLQTSLLTENCSIGQRACNSLCINSIFICMKAATLWWGSGGGANLQMTDA